MSIRARDEKSMRKEKRAEPTYVFGCAGVGRGREGEERERRTIFTSAWKKILF